MSNKFHKALTGKDIHIIHAYNFDNDVDRDAASVSSADVGKAAKMADGTFWILSSADPITWIPLTSVDTDTDEKVALKSGEAPSYLIDILEAGDNVTLSEAGGKLVIDSPDTDTDTDEKVALRSGETPMYLDDLIGVSGDLSLNEVGGRLVISYTDTDVDTDEKVALKAGAAPNYLKQLLAGGSNVTIQEVGGKLEISATDTDTDTDELVALKAGDAASYLEDLISAGTNITIEEKDGKLHISSTQSSIEAGIDWKYATYYSHSGFTFVFGSDFPVTKRGSFGLDPDNSSYYTFQFDDYTPEGVQFFSEAPAGSTKVRFHFRYHARSDAGGNNVCGRLHFRDKAPGDDFDGGWQATPFFLMATNGDDNMKYHTEEFNLSDIGLDEGQWTNWEFIRQADESQDDTVGDLILLAIGIEYV